MAHLVVLYATVAATMMMTQILAGTAQEGGLLSGWLPHCLWWRVQHNS
jgi:hypothetical protein